MTRSLAALGFAVLVGAVSTAAQAQDHQPSDIIQRWSFKCDGKPYIIDLHEAPPKGSSVISWINNGVPIDRDDRRQLDAAVGKLALIDQLSLSCVDATATYVVGGPDGASHRALTITFENGTLKDIKP